MLEVPITHVTKVAERLRQLLVAVELKPADFCRRAKIGTTALNNWTQALSRPELDMGIVLAREFGITLDWLYMGEPAALPRNLAFKIAQAALSAEAPAGEAGNSKKPGARPSAQQPRPFGT